MTPPRRIQTVLFDVGGTLLRAQPSVSAVYSAVAAEHGFSVLPGNIEGEFRAAWRRSVERSRARGYRTSDEILREEWLKIVRETFGESVPPASLPSLFEDLYERFASARTWQIVPGVRETLRYLRGAGVRLGVLSNWDSRLERMLHELELASAFDFLVISHDVGCEKPHSAIFETAIARSGSDPQQTLHVGDSYHADIVPAKRMKMQTLWIAPDAERQGQQNGEPGLSSFPEKPLPFWPHVISPPP
jgi:putative hydrolase of the HAD superfamily